MLKLEFNQNNIKTEKIFKLEIENLNEEDVIIVDRFYCKILKNGIITNVSIRKIMEFSLLGEFICVPEERVIFENDFRAIVLKVLNNFALMNINDFKYYKNRIELLQRIKEIEDYL